jgi:DNA-binding transcriptional LysR family regulator
MIEVTVQQLQCFDAVATEGSFQAAAERMRRAQPSVSLAVKNLEAQLGLSLFDRSGYRVKLTDAGRSFHERARILLHELRALKTHAAQLAMGIESELRVVIGDLCPLPENLALLRAFSMAALAHDSTYISKRSLALGNASSMAKRISFFTTSIRATRAWSMWICSRCASFQS